MLHKIVFILGLLFITFSCGQPNENNTISTKLDTTSTNSIRQNIDTAYTIIRSDDSPNAAGLSDADIKEVNKIFLQCITDNQKYLRASTEYMRQYFPFINDKGEKEVRVNCFCSAMGRDWKKNKIAVLDGGNCFFNFCIRLKTKKYYDLIINGEA